MCPFNLISTTAKVKDLNAVIEILDLYVVEPEIDLRIDRLSFHGIACRPMAIHVCFLDPQMDDEDRDLLPREIFEKYGGEGFWDLLDELEPFLESSIQVFPYVFLDFSAGDSVIRVEPRLKGSRNHVTGSQAEMASQLNQCRN